jgi:hypothetical protein
VDRVTRKAPIRLPDGYRGAVNFKKWGKRRNPAPNNPRQTPNEVWHELVELV